MTGTFTRATLGRSVLGAVTLGLLALGTAPSASALTLQEAIQLTVSTNPEIGEARANRLAIDHELAQARGLYLPQVDAEAEVGPEFSDTPTVRSRGDLDGDWALPRWQLSLVIQQRVFDAESSLIAVKRAQLEQFVAVNLALGGDWEAR